MTREDSEPSIARHFLDLTKDGGHGTTKRTRSIGFFGTNSTVGTNDGSDSLFSNIRVNSTVSERDHGGGDYNQDENMLKRQPSRAAAGVIEIQRKDGADDSISVLTRTLTEMLGGDDSTTFVAPGAPTEESQGSESLAGEYVEGWELADTAFIESVHGVANDLETRMIEQGLETPFWPAESVRSLSSQLPFISRFLAVMGRNFVVPHEHCIVAFASSSSSSSC